MSERRWKMLKKFREKCAGIAKQTGYEINLLDCSYRGGTSNVPLSWTNDLVVVEICRPSGMPVKAINIHGFEGMRP